MRRTSHIALMIGIRVFALMLVALPAFAQPPDTLLVTPCQIASLSSVVDLSPSALWVRGIYVSHEMRTLDTIGATVAAEPLSNFTENALAIARNANNEYLFKRQVYSRYTTYDPPEWNFDTALLGRAFVIARRLINPSTRSMLFLAPSLRSPTDSVAILVTSRSLTSYGAFTGPVSFTIDSLRIIDDPTEVVPATGNHKRVSFAVREAPVPEYAAEDSVAVMAWMSRSGLGDATAYRMRLREELADSFKRRYTRSIYEIWELRIGRDLVHHDVEYFLGWGSDIFRLLDAFGADTIFTRARVEDIILALYCNDSESAEATVPYDASDSLLFSFDEFDDADTTPYDCAKEFNFSDTTRWNEFADSIRSLLPHYLAFPDRVYAVVAGDTVHTFLAFVNDTTRATPVVITRDELEAMPAVEGTDWHERLMRSIRGEECWAERMEGY